MCTVYIDNHIYNMFFPISLGSGTQFLSLDACLQRFKSYGEHSDAELLRTYGFVTLAHRHIFLAGGASCCDLSHAKPYVFSYFFIFFLSWSSPSPET